MHILSADREALNALLLLSLKTYRTGTLSSADINEMDACLIVNVQHHYIVVVYVDE